MARKNIRGQDSGLGDLLCEAAGWNDGFVTRKERKYGCDIAFSDIDGKAAAALGRREGRYCTVRGDDVARALAYAMKQLASARKVLFAGLGNSGLVADALGGETVRALRKLCDENTTIATLEPLVKAVTNLDSAAVVKAVAREYRPDLVIVADALVTREWEKIGASYQLTTAGICPGSGAGGNGDMIDGAYLGTAVLAVGVPMIAVLRDDGERRVIPYDAESTVRRCSALIASAVFAAYS